MTTDRSWLIGVNRGRGETVGEVGHGMWVPLHTIHDFLLANHYEWLLKVDFANWLPIVDPPDILGPIEGYVPLP